MYHIEDIEVNNAELDPNAQSRSQLSLKSFYYSWTLADISKFLSFPSAIVHSPEFDFEDTTWRLTLNVFSNGSVINELKVRLCKIEKGGTSYYLKYKMSLFGKSGSFATQEAQSKFEGDNILGHRLSFKREEHTNILDAAVQNNEFVIHCEFLVLSTITCSDSVDPNTTPKITVSMKNAKKPESSEAIPPKRKPKRIVKRISEARSERRETNLLFLLFLCCIVMLMPISSKRSVIQNRNDIKEINDLVISTTLKVINIADSLNLTEVKTKSVDFLRSYYKDYNISDIEFSKGNVSDVLSSKSGVSELKAQEVKGSSESSLDAPPK